MNEFASSYKTKWVIYLRIFLQSSIEEERDVVANWVLISIHELCKIRVSQMRSLPLRHEARCLPIDTICR